MKIVRLVSRIIIGLVFIFSGIVKAIDPLGSAYKFHDYFQAFNLGFLNALSLILAIIMCTAEFISGFAVLTGVRQKTGILGVLLLLIIFTPITFWIASRRFKNRKLKAVPIPGEDSIYEISSSHCTN